jgi:rod shape-determining protein MreC
VVFFTLLAVVLMMADHRQQLGEPVREALAATVYPLQLMVDLPFRMGDFFSDQFGSRRQLMEENAQLRAQALLNETRLQRLDTLERENINLRALLQSSYEVAEPALIAELMRVDLDPTIHIIQINKGRRDRVFVGQPVLDANGITGQVDRLGPYSATVRLITDPSHALPVQVNRNGLRTIAIGTGDLKQLDIVNLPTNADIEVGDLLVTSGLGGRFPPGYPVARVTRVEIDPGQPFARIKAAPTAALDRSRQLLLVQGQEAPEDFAPEVIPARGRRR